MRADALVDTGFLVAVLDRDDRWHRPCVAALGNLRLPLATTEAVLTELFHLVGEQPTHVAAAWRLLRSGAVTVVPIGDDDLPALDELMEKFSDRPMDFADATLVHVAVVKNIDRVATIDHDDFETYRFGVRRRFRIVPDRLPRRR